jgi:hypothetical protein
VRDALRGDAFFFRQVGRAAHVGRARVRRAAGGHALRWSALARLRGCGIAQASKAIETACAARLAAPRPSRFSGICDSSPISSPAKVTDSASRLSRLPSQTGHRLPAM